MPLLLSPRIMQYENNIHCPHPTEPAKFLSVWNPHGSWRRHEPKASIALRSKRGGRRPDLATHPLPAAQFVPAVPEPALEGPVKRRSRRSAQSRCAALRPASDSVPTCWKTVFLSRIAPAPWHVTEIAALTADYTALVGLSQSTSGRVRPRTLPPRLYLKSCSAQNPKAVGQIHGLPSRITVRFQCSGS